MAKFEVFAFMFCLALFIETGHCCSCVPESLSRSRTAAIRDDFCFSSSVYTARVVGATCNCISNSTLHCVDYQQQSSTIEAELIDQGECAGETHLDLDNCANLNTVLAVNINTRINATGTPTKNLSIDPDSGRCDNICPFNNLSSAYEHGRQPCFYSVEIVETFKTPNNATVVGATLQLSGPDVLTTCGNPSRRLNINEMYVVGIGGACNPFSAWSRVDSYSQAEINILRQLGINNGLGLIDCGALGVLPSLVTLLGALLTVFIAQS